MPRLVRVLSLSTLCAVAAVAADAHPAESGSHVGAIISSLGSLVLGIVQLVVGLGIAAFAINEGLALVSKLLGGLDIWGEIKKKNLAVALLAAGAVVSYANVIGSGIRSMTDALTTLVTGGVWNGLIGLLSGVINLVVAIAVASFAITVTFKIMDKLTKDIDEKAELSGGNTAIGLVYCGILIGVSFLVSSGVSGIGKGLSSFLSALATAIGLN